jgi:hypothetical protein
MVPQMAMDPSVQRRRQPQPKAVAHRKPLLTPVPSLFI